MVEGDGGDEVVQDVGFDDAVEEDGTDGGEVAVDCCEGAAGEGPDAGEVVGEGGVGVLEECYGDWERDEVSFEGGVCAGGFM